MATNPPVLDTLASLQLPQQVSPLPPTNPVQPDLQSTFASILGKGESALQNQRALAGQAAAVPPAPVGFKPNFDGGFLHNLGQALLLAGAATRPGQSMMEIAQAPAQARRAQALSAIKTQMEPEQEAEKFYGSAAEGAGRLGYEQGMLFNRGRQADIAQERADTQAKNVQSQIGFRDFMKGLDTQKLGLENAKLVIESRLKEEGVQVQRERNQVILSLGNNRVALDESKYNAAVQNKTQGFFDQIGQALGLKEFATANPSGVSGAGTQPLNKPQATPSRTGGGPSTRGNRRSVYDPKTGTLSPK